MTDTMSAVGRVLKRKNENMGQDAQDSNERESAKPHQASVEIADALAKMFTDLKPKIIAKYSLSRAKYRGRPKVQIQAYLSAIVQNLKRLLFPIYCWVFACWTRRKRDAQHA